MLGCGKKSESKDGCKIEPNANCPSADFSGVTIEGGDFHGAKLSEANFDGATFLNVDLRGADLSQAKLNKAVFRGVKLSGARLPIDLSTFICTECELVDYQVAPHGILTRANFSGSNLAGLLADEMNLDVSNANFRGANLKKARFGVGVNLLGAVFEKADLSGVSFHTGAAQKANFREATITDVVFDNMDLMGADFTGVKGGGTELTNVAVCPDGTKPSGGDESVKCPLSK